MDKADAEAVVVEWLNTIVGEGWSASGNKPKNAGDQFILVDRTGGARESMVLDLAEILVEVYHKTSRSTAKNKANEIADRAVELEAYEHNITKSVVNSVVHLPDLISQYERYQIYLDVNCRR